jgi:hypothetical protein
MAQGLQGLRTDLERQALSLFDLVLHRLPSAAARLVDILVVAVIFTVLA